MDSFRTTSESLKQETPSESPSISKKKEIFMITSSNGKISCTVNRDYQKELNKSLLNLIECIYNQYALSFGFSDIDSLLVHLKDSLKSTRSSLGSLENFADQQILSTTAKISNFEEASNESLRSQALLMLSSVQVFTEIDADFKSKIEYEAVISELQVRKSKEKEYLNLRVFHYNKKKELFSTLYKTNLDKFKIEIKKIKEELEVIKLFEKKILANDTLTDFIGNPKLIDECSAHIKNLDSFLVIASQLNKDLEYLKFEINYLHNNEDIERISIEKNGMLEFERKIEPILNQDLQNLNCFKGKLERKIKKYSPVWVCKHFEKNLNILRKDLNKIVNSLAEIQVNFRKIENKPVDEVILVRNEMIILKKLTIENYKSNLITEPEQKKISKSIKVLSYNLEALNICKNSMTVKNFNIYLNHCFFHSVIINESFIKNSKLKENYKILINEIRFLNEAMIEVLKVLNDFKLSPVEGFVYDGKSDSSLSMKEKQKLGIISVVLIRPNLNCYFFNLSLTFDDHENFKETRKVLKETLEKVETVEKRINYKEKLVNEVIAYENQLKIIENTKRSFNEPDLIDSIRFKDILKYTKYENICINRENVNLLLASIFSRLNLKEKVKEAKNHLNNSLTLEMFLKILKRFIVINAENLRRYSQINSIEAKELSKFIVSEEIIGSFLTENDLPQGLADGKVSEDFHKSFMVIAKDFALISLFQQVCLKDIRGNIGRFQELRSLIVSFSSKFGKKFAEFFLG